WDHDIHHDHQIVAKASLHSGRHVPRLLMYRSNYYHSGEPFHANFYSDISGFWEQKAHAIRAHQSEFQRGVGEKWLEFFYHQALNTGQEIGVKYAEAFKLVKW